MKILFSLILVLFFGTCIILTANGETSEKKTGTMEPLDKYLIRNFEHPPITIAGGEVLDYKIYSNANVLVLEMRTWEMEHCQSNFQGR